MMRNLRGYPTNHQLIELAYCMPFPINNFNMRIAARHMNCSPLNLHLLRQFDDDEVFENGIDFITRCEEVRMLMKEERNAPRELLRSPQG